MGESVRCRDGIRAAGGDDLGGLGAYGGAEGVDEGLALLHGLAVVVDDNVEGAVRVRRRVGGVAVEDLEAARRRVVLREDRVLREGGLLRDALYGTAAQCRTGQPHARLLIEARLTRERISGALTTVGFTL